MPDMPSSHRRPSLARLAALLAAALLVPLAAAAADKAPQQWDGLDRKQSKTLQNLFVRPNVEFKAYKSVRLDPVKVEFDKDWDPNRGVKSASKRLSQAEITEIRDGLAAGFQKVLVDTLTLGGYTLVDADGEETLRVGPALVNVYVNAPERSTAGTSRTFVMDAGKVTMFMELRDSVTGQLLARAVDTVQGQDLGRMQWSTGATNQTEANQAFLKWATALRKGLDEVNGKGGGK
jgi:hypothetical protein